MKNNRLTSNQMQSVQEFQGEVLSDFDKIFLGAIHKDIPATTNQKEVTGKKIAEKEIRY